MKAHEYCLEINEPTNCSLQNQENYIWEIRFPIKVAKQAKAIERKSTDIGRDV